MLSVHRRKGTHQRAYSHEVRYGFRDHKNTLVVELIYNRARRPELFLFLAPLAKWQNKIKVGPMGKMSDIGHAGRSVVTKRPQLVLILVRTNDHEVRADVKLIARRVVFLARNVRHPRTDVHVGDAHCLDVRIAPGEAIFYPLHEDRIETTGLVMRITRKCGKATPFVGSFP